MLKLEKNSISSGPLPEGCNLCREGAKLVLFVTGLCNFKCFYCPLSKEKKNNDVIYADEMPVLKYENIIEEAKLIDAKGTGITGGDPIKKIDRTVEFIELLKNEFGNAHHIHLYTASGKREDLEKLSNAGLDEIRFHVPVRLWQNLLSSDYKNKITISKDLGMKVGIEVPVLPDKGKELLKLIMDAESLNIDFINLNELEFSETNYESLRLKNYRTKSYISSAVYGSEKTAREIILNNDFITTVHYCSASFKDAIQLRRRLLRRAKNVAKDYEVITRDGTILKGIIEIENPKEVYVKIMNEFDIPGDLIYLDKYKNRIEIAPWILEKIKKYFKGKAYLVEEYPSWDRTEVERTPL
ncbi:MAG: radical SAM protein [Thermoplasmata archaeon]|nr:4Fe-4S cluster-binding domain-containing protein [Thermoplasmata archaeon]